MNVDRTRQVVYRHHLAARISCAAVLAIISVSLFVSPVITRGITDASATRRCCTL